MSSQIKRHVMQKVYEKVYSKTKLATVDQIASQLFISRKNPDSHVEFQVNLPITVELENEKELSSAQLYSTPISTDEVIKGFQHSGKESLRIAVDKNDLIKDVLESDPTKLNFHPPKQKIVVEFSSPNIAKPFHAGHLRSTIIGNFISNIKKKLGKDVVRINYLGDWGTQFGLLKLGVDRMNVEESELQSSPTKFLFDAYVKINQEAELDDNIFTLAREESRKLEESEPDALASWQKFTDLSKGELQKMYSRLGVQFDEYQWESNFGKNEIAAVLKRLDEQGLLKTDAKGRVCAQVRNRLDPLVRSDGASLYLARDIAAALHRRRTTGFHEMLYVVENGQADHFLSLFALCEDLKMDKAWNMKHVKFGRIHGMSTRRGQVVFLSDILDNAQELVSKRLKESKTTKVDPTDELADKLGSAAVIINDLRQRRIKDYEFNWDKALQVSGDGAVRLQYAHCRLCSLLSRSTHPVAVECDPTCLDDPAAVGLALEIARYEEVVLRSHADLEACTLVTYLFHLAHAANKAFKVLPVKGSSSHVASQRLLLFSRCKQVLGDGLRLLGVEPLEEM